MTILGKLLLRAMGGGAPWDFFAQFTAADGTNLTAYTPEKGTLTIPIGSYQITSNTLKSLTYVGGEAVANTSAVTTDDYTITCTLNLLSGGTSDGPLFRFLDSNNFMILGFNGGTGTANVGRKLAGGYSLTNFAVTENSTSKAITLHVCGPCFTAFVGTTLVAAGNFDVLAGMKNKRISGVRMAGTVGVNSADDLKITPISAPTLNDFTFTGTQDVIYDTDINVDEGDISATFDLMALAKLGEANILCMTTMCRNASSVNALYAIANYYGRSSIPIGVTSASTFTTVSPSITNLAATAFGTPGPGLAAPNAVTLMRQKLAAAADGSVVIIEVGTLNNIAELLTSTSNYLADGILRTGLDLVTSKVKHMALMGGCFGYRSDGVLLSGASPGEYNFSTVGAPASAVTFFSTWPTSVPVYLSGYEIGVQLTVDVTQSPLGISHIGRPYWDETSVLHGIRGGNWGGTTYYKYFAADVWCLNGQVGYRQNASTTMPWRIVREVATPAAQVAQINALGNAAP